MSEDRHIIRWIDHGREPQCPPDPKFPRGIYIAVTDPDIKTCTVQLPYPAKRRGIYIVECQVCKLRYGITTAGRPDDPRAVDLICKPVLQ